MNEKASENNVGKGENAVYQHFLLFPQCFLPVTKQVSKSPVIFILSSANASNLDPSKILSFGKDLSRMIYKMDLKSQQRPFRTMFVYKVQVNPIHTINGN